MRIFVRAIFLVLIAIVFMMVVSAGCQDSSEEQPENKSVESGAAEEADYSVDITGMSPPYYKPRELKIKKGEVVRWTNTDNLIHTVTAKDEAFDSKDLTSDKPFKAKFKEAGEIDYFCTIHPTMTGKIIVE